jgi:hypothetical protein
VLEKKRERVLSVGAWQHQLKRIKKGSQSSPKDSKIQNLETPNSNQDTRNN